MIGLISTFLGYYEGVWLSRENFEVYVLRVYAISILWNGKRVIGFLQKKGGLNQGDHLSPFLFVLFMKMFSSAILMKNLNGRLEPIRVAGNESGLLHLFFVGRPFIH